MKGDLYINGTDAWDHGIEMGRGFVDALGASLSFKEDIANDSALEHGRRLVLSRFVEARELTLIFNIHGADEESFLANDRWLLSVFYARELTVQVRGDENVYRLVYTGRSTSYAHRPSGLFCIRAAKFLEPNPGDR